MLSFKSNNQLYHSSNYYNKNKNKNFLKHFGYTVCALFQKTIKFRTNNNENKFSLKKF
jgi:hypothetical protein